MAIVQKEKKKAKVSRRQRRQERREERRSALPEPRHLAKPHLCLLHAPAVEKLSRPLDRELTVATYNVHRWTGLNGRGPIDPARASFVISELDADVIALQEAMRPHEGDDPLVALADALGLHVTFAATRVHKKGELGNAILSRWPIAGVSMVDLSFSRMERRVAVSAQLPYPMSPPPHPEETPSEGAEEEPNGSANGRGVLDVVATHLAIADRTRHRQVRSLLDHPRFHGGPTLLLGDMNAWRQCRATRALDAELAQAHHNRAWPASFPAARPVLALDRIYARGVRVLEMYAHKSRAARRASDHLPIVARVAIEG